MILRALAIATLGLTVTAAVAQRTIPVQFEAGTSGARLSGTVIGDEYIDYVLGASEGQLMTASLEIIDSNGNGTAYFNILPPGSTGEAIWIGNMEADQIASVTLPATGDYTLRVYQMGNDADTGATTGFYLNVGIQ
jgi:hypothetical protein